jgi:hypothetical protein
VANLSGVVERSSTIPERAVIWVNFAFDEMLNRLKAAIMASLHQLGVSHFL